MILNTQIRGEQIADDTISGSHLIAKNSPTGGYLLSWDGTEEKFSWDEPNSLVVNEIPSGSINGSNKVFTLENEPLSDTERVSLNGLLQEPGSGKDYTISGDTITFSLAPNTGDVLLVSYLMGEALGGSSGGANVPYGYSMGGYYLSTIDRITFPFDSGTASHVGYLSSSKGYAPACNSSNYGYVMGGYNGSAHMSTIDRITFPFDSGTASHVGNLLNAKAAGTGCNSSIYGYCMLGDSGGYSLSYSIVDRIAFPFDSGTANQVGNLTIASTHLGAGFNSSNYGYCSGGQTGPSTYISTMDRFAFPFDSGTANHVGNLSSDRGYAAGCNSSDYGFSMGGYSGSSTYSIVDRVNFPFDSGTASHVGNLSYNPGAPGGYNSSNYGYCMGGDDSVSVYFSTVSRITFPFDSGTASHVGNINIGHRSHIAGCDGTDFVNLFV